MKENEITHEETFNEIFQAIAREEGVSDASISSDPGYASLSELLRTSPASLSPEKAALSRLLARLPDPGAPATRPVASPYMERLSLFLSPRTLKLATPMVLFVLMIGLIAGSPWRKRGDLPAGTDVAPESAPMAMMAMRTADVENDPSLSVGDAAPAGLLMTQTARTTLPSTTPQNIGELVALLSSEADVDVDLGVSDLDDPIYSDDGVNSLNDLYDVETI